MAPKLQGGSPRQQPNTATSEPTGEKKTVIVKSGKRTPAKIIGIYGPGGIGKTGLAIQAPNPEIIDLDYGAWDYDVNTLNPETGDEWTFDHVIQTLADTQRFQPGGTLIIDSATKLEEIGRLEIQQEFGEKYFASLDYGKGYSILADKFSAFLAACQRLRRHGVNIIITAHESIGVITNPDGGDYTRWEPRLFHNAKKQTESNRQRFKEECDYVFFLNYDITVTKGKATGGEARTAYCQERPSFMAKERGLGIEKFLVFENERPSIFDQIFQQGDK